MEEREITKEEVAQSILQAIQATNHEFYEDGAETYNMNTPTLSETQIDSLAVDLVSILPDTYKTTPIDRFNFILRIIQTNISVPTIVDGQSRVQYTTAIKGTSRDALIEQLLLTSKEMTATEEPITKS